MAFIVRPFHKLPPLEKWLRYLATTWRWPHTPAAEFKVDDQARADRDNTGERWDLPRNRALRNHVVPSLPAAALATIGKGAHPIKADCIHLQAKHPEMFPTPEDVRAALDWTFTRPDAIYQGRGGPDHVSILRRGENNHHAVVDFGSESGHYRVKHITLIPDEPVAQHLATQDIKWTR